MEIKEMIKQVMCVGLAWLGLAASASAQTTIVEYIHTDALGSPVAVTDASGAVVPGQAQVYEPYGAPISHGPNDGPGFTGHVEDAATGLTYMQQRYYDPAVGSFLSVDPITAGTVNGNTFNRYWYANGNPYRFKDPDGRLACTGGNADCLGQREKLEKRGIIPLSVGASSKTKTPEKDGGDSKVPTLAAVMVIGKDAATSAGGGSAWSSGLGRTLGGMLEFARGPFLYFYTPHPCGGEPCGELRGAFSKVSDVPSVGPPGQWVDGKRRSRLYGSDGRPRVDIDTPHQGAQYPHVHEWEDGVREHPGREIPDLPPPEPETGDGA